jgi:nitrite reductase/ring-hydroxylating ferredoxin subunit
MTSHRVCKVEDIPVGKLGGFTVAGREILAANVNGRFYSLAGRCPHAGAPLKEGVLNGDTLECPWHDASFRITDGMPLNGPPKRPLEVYPCVVKGKYLYVDF